MSTKEHNEINAQLKIVLDRSENIGPIRRFLIAFIFPEFATICGDLSDLCRMLKSP